MDFIISSPKLKMDFTTDSIRSYFFNEKKKEISKAYNLSTAFLQLAPNAEISIVP